MAGLNLKKEYIDTRPLKRILPLEGLWPHLKPGCKATTELLFRLAIETVASDCFLQKLGLRQRLCTVNSINSYCAVDLP